MKEPAFILISMIELYCFKLEPYSQFYELQLQIFLTYKLIKNAIFRYLSFDTKGVQ